MTLEEINDRLEAIKGLLNSGYYLLAYDAVDNIVTALAKEDREPQRDKSEGKRWVSLKLFDGAGRVVIRIRDIACVCIDDTGGSSYVETCFNDRHYVDVSDPSFARLIQIMNL